MAPATFHHGTFKCFGNLPEIIREICDCRPMTGRLILNSATPKTLKRRF